MSGPILIFDTNNLAWRAHHSKGGLSNDDEPTGAVFGVLSDIILLQEKFRTDRVVFAFDRNKCKRLDLLPTYKCSREKRLEEATEEEVESHHQARRQIIKLRKTILPDIGFRNVFSEPGYEGDDIIALVAQTCLGEDDDAVIISSDKDLYQLIRPNVSVYRPQYQQHITLQTFKKEYGIKPRDWPRVLALAGGHDDISGCLGIGEKSALRHIRDGSLTGMRLENVREFVRSGKFDLNLRLIRLPFDGLPEIELQKDEVTYAKWKAVVTELGMRSLRKTPPRCCED